MISYTSSNFKKHHTKNLLKRILLDLFLKNINQIIDQTENISRILDAACGEGLVVKYIQDCQPNLNIDGFDISAQSVAYAKQILPDNNFFIGDILNIKIKDNSYDLVMALEVLEHLASPLKALKELSRVSKKYVLISVPFEPWFSIGNLLSGKNIKRLGQDEDHRQFWTKRKIIKLISQEMDIKLVTISFPWTVILAIKK